MTDFIQAARDGVWFLGEWSLRWGVLIGIVAVWFGVRAPRRSDVRYAIAWSVLLAGLCLPLLPQWGPGIWPGASAVHSPPAFATVPVDHSAQAAGGSSNVLPPPDPATVPELTYPPGYSGSSREGRDDATAASSATSSAASTVGSSPGLSTDPTTPTRVRPMSPGAVCYAALAILHVIGVAAMLCRLFVGLIRLRQLKRRSREVVPAVADLFLACRAELNLQSATPGMHPDLSSPIVCGLFRPSVIVPADFGDLPRATQRACLIHELTHIRRGDSWSILLTEVVRAVFFFHPLLHWLAARLNLEREYICDEAALRFDDDQQRFAADLLSFGKRGGRMQPACESTLSLPFGRRSTVKARVARLLGPRLLLTRPALPTRQRRAMMLVLMFAAAAFGALRLTAQSSPPEIAASAGAEDSQPDRGSTPARKPEIRVLYTPENGPGYGIEYHPVTVTGRAVNAEGEPIAGATVWLGTGVVTIGTKCPETKSDKEGWFSFTDVDVEVHRYRPAPVPKPTEAYITVFGVADGFGFTWHPRRSYRPYERPEGTDPADTDAATTASAFYAGEPIDLRLEFQPPARLRGQVTDDSGRPVSGARVQVGHISDVRNPNGFGIYRCTYLGPGHEGEPDGFAAISALPASYRETRSDANGFYVLSNLRRDTNYIAQVDPGPRFSPLGFEVATTVGTSTDRQRFVGYDGEFNPTYAAPRGVDVRVVAADSGRPMAGVTLLAHGRKVRRAGGQAQTDQDGRATLQLEPDEYRLFIEPPAGQDYLRAEQDLTVTKEPLAGPLELRLSPAAVVWLKAVDATTGEPIAGVSFEYETDTSRVRQPVHSQTVYVDHPRTNARGEVRAALAPGRRRFIAIDQSRPAESREVIGDYIDLTPGEVSTLQFKFAHRVDPAAEAPDVQDPGLARMNQISRRQNELLSGLRARLAVQLATSQFPVPFDELQAALNGLNPDEVPDLPTLFRRTFDRPIEMARVNVTVDGRRRRGDFERTHPTLNYADKAVDVVTEYAALFYEPFNAQADAFDSRTSRRGSLSQFRLCTWREYGAVGVDHVSLQQGRLVVETALDGLVYRTVAHDATGFLYRAAYQSAIAPHGQAEWQFAPQTHENGLVLPGMRIEVNYRNGEVDRLNAYIIDSVELVDDLPADAFAIALPPGVNVLDWRKVDPGGPQRPAAGVITGPVSDMLAHLNRREGARSSIEPVVKYGTPAPKLQVAHWLTADGPVPAPDTRGKVVLIDFWGITCGFCVAQLDDVRAVAKHLTAEDFLLIGLHDADGTVEEVAAFARDKDLRYQLAIDRPPTEEGWFGATTQAFGIRGIPQAAVIDREGKVVYLGEFDQALIHVGRLLNGAASNP